MSRSMPIDPASGPKLDNAGFPELTELGKRIEVLRIGRALSKQHLARYAGTSRQQLWRVITGKSELTGALRTRLAEVLRVDPGQLARAGIQASADTTSTTLPPLPVSGAANELSRYLSDPAAIGRTLASLPNGDGGRVLKRRLLDHLEDLSLAQACTLPAAVFELRRRVMAGEL